MSSAILYVAIVVIWACVLIPRWLRRESSHASPVADKTAGEVAPGDVAFGEDVGESAVDRQEDVAGDAPKQDEAPPPPPPLPPLTPEESRRRMLAARRRLFGMLMALEVAAIALAVFRMAALWVVIPPSVMLGWYMLLLREAARADAERASRELEAAHARARARERARARAAARESVAAPAGPASVAGAGSAGAAGSAAGYEDAGPGRDFAPGLAGKYITSNAEVIDISARTEDYYKHATENKLRAVGD